MKIACIGGGLSSVISAINLKSNLGNKIDVLIIDKNPEILRKLTITGNGKCNILNTRFNDGILINNEGFAGIFKNFSYNELKKYYENIGIVLKEKDELVYPYNESAKQVRNILFNKLNELGVEIINNELVIDYFKEGNKYKILTNNNEYTADYLIFGTGGKSYSKLGADDSILSVLKKHNYKINEFKSALCPIKLYDVDKRLEGVRCKANVKLNLNGKLKYIEPGEILFKKDGVSGIVIFNLSLFLRKNNFDPSKDEALLSISLADEYDMETLDFLEKKLGSAGLLNAYVDSKIAKVFLESKKNVKELLTDWRFKIKDLYPIEDAQISYGGIDLNCLNNDFSSKIEDNVSFVGELLDISGYCGGYNLSICLMTALIATRKILNNN